MALARKEENGVAMLIWADRKAGRYEQSSVEKRLGRRVDEYSGDGGEIGWT